jgi:hypothetical protein
MQFHRSFTIKYFGKSFFYLVQIEARENTRPIAALLLLAQLKHFEISKISNELFEISKQGESIIQF